MANRTFFNTQAVNRELKFLSVAGKVTGTGTSSATGAVVLYQGNTDQPVSVGATATADLRASSGSGTSAITFTLGDGTNVDKYEALLGVFYTPRNSAAPTHVTAVADTVKTDGKVVVTLNAEPATNDEFYVTFALKNTGVLR